MLSKTPTLAIVVPCYNEEEAFPHCLCALQNIVEKLINTSKISIDSYILFVDDGSKDHTWDMIESASSNNKFVNGVKLSRNKGHQMALLAGLFSTQADITISIDADLQDDVKCIESMVDKYHEGFDIVYGVRNNRDSDSFFKRFTANVFYKTMAKCGVNQVANHADFRLLSRRALNSLLQYKEQNVYLRGLIPLIGYKSTNVYYRRDERVAGESKYPLSKMIALAMEGVTSLTITPLRVISLTGFITCAVSALFAVYAIIEKIQGATVLGWTSVMIAIFFLGGVQMLSLGIIGEYIGRIYMECKHRPKFFIEKNTLGITTENNNNGN